jgi:cysteinyl-tRNA synthetase
METKHPHFKNLLLCLISTCLLDCVFSFHLFLPASFTLSDQYHKHPALRLLNPLYLSSNGDDDWYSDFKPRAYSSQENRFPSTFNRNDRGSSGRGGDRRTGGRGRGRGGGGPAKYVRDTSMDESRVDVDTVERLLDQRTAARRRNDFDEADQIRSTLLNEHGVQVWDREGIWRTGASDSGSGMRRREDPSQRGRGRGGNRPPRPPKEFGPTGHDYLLSPDAGPLAVDISESEIHALIAARLRAKMSRNFDQADQIQAELTDAGVYIHDGRKEWRADGTMFGDYASSGDRPGRERGSRRDRDSAPYDQSPYSSGIDVLTEEEIADINSMVSRRAGAKLSRNYKTADRIRDELKAEYNVFLEDRLRQWSVGGDFGSDSPSNQDTSRFQPWKMSTFSGPVIDEAQESAILTQLENRDTAKATRDFDTADDIRDSLLSDYDVVIDDRLREWSVGGDFGLKPSSKKRDSYARRGGGELTADQEADILDIVEQRAIAKKNRDFDAADELRDILDEQFSVKVDDKSTFFYQT